MLVDFVRHLEAMFDNDIENIRVELGSGNCRDFPDYKRRCGQIAGLQKAKDRVRELLNANVDDLDADDNEEGEEVSLE